MACCMVARILQSMAGSRMMCRAARTLMTSSVCSANHYDVLGITPKATQNDIKTAYYKLSKIYHPDKSDDETSAKKFRSITEAYKVLGNIKLKKMYDKGLLVGNENLSRMEYRPEPEPTDPVLRFHKSRENRQVTPTMDGRTPIYDFDSWSKQHYGDLFQKQQYDKEFLKKKRAKQEDAIKAGKQEALMYIMFVIGGLFMALVVQGTDNYDKDVVLQRRAQEKQTNNKDSRN